ncbi:MAG: EGF domain-containing protein [Polyangiales bacterium]
MRHTFCLTSAFFLFATLLATSNSASAHPSDVNTRYGRTELPGTIAHECNDCHVDPVNGGDCNASSAADPWSPCLNVFGIEYRTRGWSSSLGDGDSDGDGISNLAELDGGGSAGFPVEAEANCDMLVCAGGAGSPVTCAGNVLCRATRITGPATAGSSPAPENANAYHYRFAFSCAPGTVSPPSNSDVDWGDNCTDVNECDANHCGTGTCSERPLAGWSAPGFDCSCPAGFAFDGTGCVLVDACLAGVDDCVAAAACLNTPGSSSVFACDCADGYEGNGRASGTGCNDIDECAADPCGPNDDGAGPRGNGCFERPVGSWSSPGYACSCAAGYASNGTRCAVATECTAGLDNCVAIASCVDPTNAIGDFVCSCPAGYLGDGSASGSGCTDVNECGRGIDNCDENAACINTPGSFACTCNGPEWAGDGVTCTDYDECGDFIFSGTCDDNATCNNLSPGFSCACDEGFTGDGAMCTDIDECALGMGGCREDEECVNNVGADNDCVCPPGFVRADAADPASACETFCGDGIVVTSEECDAGAANSDAEADACRTTCRLPFCGDGVTDSGEMCDPGGGEQDVSICTTLCPADMDAGVPDAGGLDAGMDAGGDAGMDAGGVDAGMDTGGMDAGGMDAGGDSGASLVGPSGGACSTTPGSGDSSPFVLFTLLGALAFVRRRTAP